MSIFLNKKNMVLFRFLANGYINELFFGLQIKVYDLYARKIPWRLIIKWGLIDSFELI